MRDRRPTLLRVPQAGRTDSYTGSEPSKSVTVLWLMSLALSLYRKSRPSEAHFISQGADPVYMTIPTKCTRDWVLMPRRHARFNESAGAWTFHA
jgi:hypothetical protein